MTKWKINKKDITKLLSKWGREFTIFAPSRDKGMTRWTEWDGKDTSFLDWNRNTDIPPKAVFLPPLEKMFGFYEDGGRCRVELPVPDTSNWLIFGIRPCDAKAMAILDINFGDAYEDPYYLGKRKRGVLVGLGCVNPYDSCFCTSLGTGPVDAANVDLMMIDIGDEFFIEAVTDNGEKLIAKANLAQAAESDETRANEVNEIIRGKVTKQIDTEGVAEKLLSCFEDEPYWTQVAATCLSCGLCTFLCPTCYCFDINDEMVENQVKRLRSWDSCSFSVYTRMPAENPRSEKWRRLRQKVCHKYKFYPMSFGVIACTGCGRCIRLCPVNWDITRVLASLPTATKSSWGKHNEL